MEHHATETELNSGTVNPFALMPLPPPPSRTISDATDPAIEMATQRTLMRIHALDSYPCVYPREIIKRGLDLGCAAVILAHNHPSGVAEPSRSDEMLTQALKTALALVDMRVLDHLVVGSGEVISFAERGLL